MTTMVERVARALAEIKYSYVGGAEADTLGKPHWQFCLVEARAAIAAMREPTDEMIKVGNCRAVCTPEEWCWSWEDAIAAALGEDEVTG